MKYNSLHLDLVGMVASLLCAIHCAALPVLLGATALGGIHFLADPLIEHLVLYFSLGIAFLSLLYSYWSHHGRELPIIMAAIGFVLIVGVHIIYDGHEGSYFLLALGGLLVASAHLINFKWTKTCHVPHMESTETGTFDEYT